MAGLTTHVLDTAHGRPAANLRVELWRLDGKSWTRIAHRITNADGRTDPPLLSADDTKIGTYELRFGVDDYFSKTGLADDALPFLNEVPVRFTIADVARHYHVPLLVAPWSYTTYRGS